jgi:hypothetical protein
MPDGVGAAPQPVTLELPNRTYVKPENPLDKLRSKAVQGVQDAVANGPRLPQPQLANTYVADAPS